MSILRNPANESGVPPRTSAMRMRFASMSASFMARLVAMDDEMGAVGHLPLPPGVRHQLLPQFLVLDDNELPRLQAEAGGSEDEGFLKCFPSVVGIFWVGSKTLVA
jgi:hypothetical protein